MRKYEGKVVGILGTVIFHLVAAIIFMSFQIRSLKVDQTEMFTVEFVAVEEPESQEKIIELPASNIERILQGDEEMLNIARNLSNRPEEKVDPSDYIDMVKDELIKDGKLGVDNYIDEQKKPIEPEEGNLAIEDNKEAADKNEEPSESEKMAANYQGPTRIYYELAGRNHSYLPIPVYKCQGSGKIVLLIQVNQKGIVEEARIIEGESTTADICLTEAAIATALISRFNTDIRSPKIQTGTLTYQFVAQ
jgi:outer membrane biosynthesis protein TonB